MCEKQQEPLDFNLGQLYRVFHYPCLISCLDLCKPIGQGSWDTLCSRRIMYLGRWKLVSWRVIFRKLLGLGCIMINLRLVVTILTLQFFRLITIIILGITFSISEKMWRPLTIFHYAVCTWKRSKNYVQGVEEKFNATPPSPTSL